MKGIVEAVRRSASYTLKKEKRIDPITDSVEKDAAES
jgi:hypothetical protein